MVISAQESSPGNYWVGVGCQLRRSAGSEESSARAGRAAWAGASEEAAASLIRTLGSRIR